ncbi:ubiquitin-conjugating enzyme/RWD-like protein [Xylariaceae sp. FL0016]|nr:ubiquitin-conjugating enzyme/RWD-like protein [Xylariaceae sp. FL0016]
MTTSIAVKRMTKERITLEKENLDYIVHFDDENMLKFDAYVRGPDETIYQHKLIRLRFEVPDRYPMVPPKVFFTQHSGGRIHPNLYNEGARGKVCLSILGTWQGEPWAFAMTCDTVLITIRSLLDNSPYQHEPGCGDNPGFNKYVEYTTWRWLLLDYLKNENVPALRMFLQKHVEARGPQIVAELRRQAAKNETSFSSPYNHNVNAQYQALIRDFEAVVPQPRAAKLHSDLPLDVELLTRGGSGGSLKRMLGKVLGSTSEPAIEEPAMQAKRVKQDNRSTARSLASNETNSQTAVATTGETSDTASELTKSCPEKTIEFIDLS